MTERGGYPCPYCPHREFTHSMLRQHIHEEHPEEKS